MKTELEEETAYVRTEPGEFLLRAGLAESGAVTGIIRRLPGGGDAAFAGLDQAALMIDGWLDERGLSPGGRKLRTFALKRSGRSGGERFGGEAVGADGCAGIIPIGAETFLIRVLYREHASWQGEVRWREQNVCFRSVLELMSLVRGAVESSGTRGRPSWGERSERAEIRFLSKLS